MRLPTSTVKNLFVEGPIIVPEGMLAMSDAVPSSSRIQSDISTSVSEYNSIQSPPEDGLGINSFITTAAYIGFAKKKENKSRKSDVKMIFISEQYGGSNFGFCRGDQL